LRIADAAALHYPVSVPTVFYTDQHHIPLPDGHKFPLSKYRKVREQIESDSRLASHLELVPAPLASAEDAMYAHDPDYVRQFLSGALSAPAMRRIGFPWSEALVARTMASVGATLAATEVALSPDAWSGTLAGGTHHAFRAEGSGFCVFNDIAIAISKLLAHDTIDRAAVIDLDVHQGDGTAEIFRAEPRVFTLSLHSRTNFPFRKQHSRLDLELADGTGDDDYLRTLDHALPQLFAFEPEIVFYQAGVDALSSDTLGHLNLTHDGLRERDRRVFESVRAHRVPLVITLGGGYSRPVEDAVLAHLNTYRTAIGVFGEG